MKVVAIDNFNRESVADILVAEGLSEQDAQRLATEKNEQFSGPYAPRHYVVTPDDYKLWRGMEELI